LRGTITAEAASLNDGIFTKNFNNVQIIVGVSLLFQRRLRDDDNIQAPFLSPYTASDKGTLQ
jgi:hypothetical protein